MIIAGTLYFLGGLLVLLAWVLWLLFGKRVAARFVEHLLAGAAERAVRTGRLRTATNFLDPFASFEAQDPKNRKSLIFWTWLPTVLFLPWLGAALVASAIEKFTS